MEEKVKEIVRKEFGANILSIERITEGYSHFMYDVKVDKQPYEIIVRFSNNVKENANLAKEKYVIDIFSQHGIPVPRIYAFHHPVEKKEEGYMILEKIQGTRLDLIWKSLSKEEQIQITLEMGKMLAKMHSIHMEDFGVIEENGKIQADRPFKFRKIGEQLPFNKFVRAWFNEDVKSIGRLFSYYHISPSFIAEVLSYLAHHRKTILYEGKPVLIHGDFMPGHLFVEKQNKKYKIVGLIDFEFAAAYAPEYDFIKLHREGFFDDPDLKKALREGYGNFYEPAVEVHRVMRDLGLAWAVLEAGDKVFSDKVLKSVGEMIRKQTKD